MKILQYLIPIAMTAVLINACDDNEKSEIRMPANPSLKLHARRLAASMKTVNANAMV